MSNAQVARLVQSLLSDDNNIRNEAEKNYKAAKQSALGSVMVEFSTIVGNPATDSGTRGAVAVLLRKLIFDLTDADYNR